MDLATQLVFLIIFAFIGFGTYQLFGINVYKLYSDIGSIVFILGLLGFLSPLLFNPYSISPTEAEWRLTGMITFFVESLPSAIIGDLAGTMVSIIVGEKR